VNSSQFSNIVDVLNCASRQCCRIRWYPETLSSHWYSKFVSEFNEDPALIFSWLVGVPFACFVGHTVSVNNVYFVTV
jgi:hypothetical protein